MAVGGTRGLELQQPAAAQAAVVITHVPLLLTEGASQATEHKITSTCYDTADEQTAADVLERKQEACNWALLYMHVQEQHRPDMHCTNSRAGTLPWCVASLYFTRPGIMSSYAETIALADDAMQDAAVTDRAGSLLLTAVLACWYGSLRSLAQNQQYQSPSGTSAGESA
jgi:hypothetical protein